MILNEININIIESELIRESKDLSILDNIKCFINKTLIDFILSDKNALLCLPDSIINNNIDYLKKYSDDILQFCNLNDMDLIQVLLSNYSSKNDIYFFAQNILSNSSLRPELFHLVLPDIFTEHILLNYSSVKLKDKYLLQLKNIAPNVDVKFFKFNRITKKFIKKVLKEKNQNSLQHFFNVLAKAMEIYDVEIEEDAVIYCMNKATASYLLAKYSFTSFQQMKILKKIESDETALIDFIKYQNLSKYMISKFIKKNLIHFYLAHNPYCTDEMLIDSYKTNQNLNWLYINTNINISNHIQYAKYLNEIGQLSIILYNLQINAEKGNVINNIRTFEKFNMDKTMLYFICLSKVRGLDVGLFLN